MPIMLLDVPLGARADAKRKMVEKMTAALDETFHIPDVRIFIREHGAGNAAQDGRFDPEAVRAVGTLEIPRLRSVDVRRKLAGKLHAAFAEAYAGIGNPDGFAVILHENAPENGIAGGRLISDIPEAMEFTERLNGDAA